MQVCGVSICKFNAKTGLTRERPIATDGFISTSLCKVFERAKEKGVAACLWYRNENDANILGWTESYRAEWSKEGG